MSEYSFKKIADDGSVFHFKKKMPSAYFADRWSMKSLDLWMAGKISFLVVFQPEAAEA